MKRIKLIRGISINDVENNANNWARDQKADADNKTNGNVTFTVDSMRYIRDGNNHLVEILYYYKV